MTKLRRFTEHCPALKSSINTILLTLLFCISNFNYAQIKAFPTAEGFGKYATGGRGGTVIKVTNLNDSGPGSLREAVMYTSGPRTVVFEVGGTITLQSALGIENGDITIAGQTAPGDGILIKGSMVIINDSNVIIRYLRFRPGNSLPTTADALNITAWGNDTVENIIIDHCSMSWAKDENFNIRTSGEGNSIVRNITMQNSIISEATYGVLSGGRSYNITYYKNMLAHNQERNIVHNFPLANEFNFEMINNLIYGCLNGTQIAFGGKFTVLNNEYEKSSEQILYPNVVDGTSAGQGTPSSTYAHIENNLVPYGTNEVSAGLMQYLENTPFSNSGIAPIPANQVANSIISNVGCSYPNRDAVDIRLINQYNTNTGRIATSGTYPIILNGTAPSDSDNDGMPNVWEIQNGLNPNNASDRNIVQPDGYTNLEYFLNGMSIVTTTETECSNEVSSFPYTEGFENTLGAWTQSSVDDMDWTITANGTPSSGTGPSSASQGTYYVFAEASGNPAKQSLLNSPCFDLSSLSGANFSFKYHQFGSTDMGTIDLELSDDNGATWTSIWNSSGSGVNTWQAVNIDLGAYVGSNIKLRFNRVIGNSYQADIAIDDVSLSQGVSSVSTNCSGGITSFPYTEGFENSLGAWSQSSVDDMDWTITANGTPSSGTGPSSASQGTYYVFAEASGNPAKQSLLNSPCFDLSSLSGANFSFKYHQYGSTDMGTIDLEVSNDNGATWTSIWNSSGSGVNTWQVTNIDLGAYVGSNIKLRFNRVIGNSYQADIAIDDVSLSQGVTTGSTDCSGEITTFPYTEGFENTLGAWTQSSVDDMDWTITANGTPSSGTGPSSASQGTYYVFAEASGNPAKQSLLNSPCFDLSSLSGANFSFKYHQFGSTDMGTIDLELSDDNGATWTSIWNSSGSGVNTWQAININLGVYVGSNIKLRFNRVIGNSYQADIAIDDVSLSQSVSTGSTNCSGGITSFPYTEGFENSLGAWSQSSVDDMDWTITANGTPSSGTGPSSASQGTYYVFAEASGNPAKQSLLNSPCFDLSSLSGANFSFKYHQYGSTDMGTIDLEVSNDNGATWTSIWNSSGSGVNTWQVTNIDLGAYVGGNIKLRFNRVIGNSYQADIAIDDVSLSEGISISGSGCSRGIDTFPYSEGFENTLGAWSQSPADDFDWTVNANGTPSSGTGPSSASQGTYYVFAEASGNLSSQALLQSPCFDLSGLSSAIVNFNYHQFGSLDMGTLDVEASNDNGVSWNKIWQSSGNLGDSWKFASINLSNYIGGTVQLRFNRITSSTWEADIAIDNFNLSAAGVSSRETTTTTKTIAFEDTKDILLYPNPVKGGLLHIKSTYTNISFEIYNMVGQLVSGGKVKNRVIDVGNFNVGMYQIRFSSEGEIITKRFIKQ